MKSHFFQHIFTGLFFSAQYASCLTSQQDLRRRHGDMADQACWSRNLAWTFDCSHKWQRAGSQVLYKGPHCSWTVVHPDESLCMIFLLFSKVFIIWDLLNLPNIKNIFYSSCHFTSCPTVRKSLHFTRKKKINISFNLKLKVHSWLAEWCSILSSWRPQHPQWTLKEEYPLDCLREVC